MVATYDGQVTYYDKYLERLSQDNNIKLEEEVRISKIIEPTKYSLYMFTQKGVYLVKRPNLDSQSYFSISRYFSFYNQISKPVKLQACQVYDA